MKKIILTILAAVMMSMMSLRVDAHCQLPCGIYDDSLQVAFLYEHILTIEKSMNMIVELSDDGVKNYNQIVRWVNDKEKHADEIQETVAYYFMTQRIVPEDPSNLTSYAKYTYELQLLHKMQVLAMKCKQTTDLEYVKSLRVVLHKFEHSYFGGGE